MAQTSEFRAGQLLRPDGLCPVSFLAGSDVYTS